MITTITRQNIIKLCSSRKFTARLNRLGRFTWKTNILNSHIKDCEYFPLILDTSGIHVLKVFSDYCKKASLADRLIKSQSKCRGVFFGALYVKLRASLTVLFFFSTKNKNIAYMYRVRAIIREEKCVKNIYLNQLRNKNMTPQWPNDAAIFNFMTSQGYFPRRQSPTQRIILFASQSNLILSISRWAFHNILFLCADLQWDDIFYLFRSRHNKSLTEETSIVNESCHAITSSSHDKIFYDVVVFLFV